MKSLAFAFHIPDLSCISLRTKLHLHMQKEAFHSPDLSRMSLWVELHTFTFKNGRMQHMGTEVGPTLTGPSCPPS